MSPDLDALRDELNDWLDVLKSEVQSLVIDRHVFWEVQRIIQNNKRIQIGSTFYGWMGSLYASGMSVAVRRQVDEDTRSISFINFLKRIRSSPQLISRERYKKLFTAATYPKGWADACFDDLVGKGQEYIDSAAVTKEIEVLKDRTQHLAKFVNKRIAHRDQQDF